MASPRSALVVALAALTLGCPAFVSDDYALTAAGGSAGASTGAAGSGAQGTGASSSGGDGTGGGGGGIVDCPAGMADCDLDPSNGCEASLTSPSTCGSCQRDCDGGTCTGDPPLCGPVVLSGDAERVRGVAVDDQHVYWTDSGSYRIRRVPVGGGATENLTFTQFWPSGIAINSTHVYWVEGEQNGSRVMRMTLDGNTEQILANFQPFAHDVVLDDTFVYFTASADGTIRRIPLGGGSNDVVLGGQNGPVTLGILNGTLYFSENWATRVRRVGVNGGNVQSYQGTSNVPRGVSAHPDAVVWTIRDMNDDFTGDVVKASPSGGGEVVLASGQPRPHTAVTDGTNVYFTCVADKNPGAGSVRMVPLGGGAVRTLSDGEYTPRDIVIRGDAVYYGTSEAIKKIVR